MVGRTALEQVLGTAEGKARNGAAGAVEEDARLTALFVWTLQTTNNDPHPRPLSQGERGVGMEGPLPEGEDETVPRGKQKGYSLVFDVVRRFAQPLGIDLPKWEGRIIETKKGVVRLLSVTERSVQLSGRQGAEAVADWMEYDPSKNIQGVLFAELEGVKSKKLPKSRRARKAIMASGDMDFEGERGTTTLDRVHAAMLLIRWHTHTHLWRGI